MMICLSLHGQNLDSAQLDLENLSDIDFFNKYSFHDKTTSSEDIRVTKLIWSLEQVRKVDKSLRQKGVRTFTMVDSRPSKENPYYIVGHYQLPTPDHLSRMSFYRVDVSKKTVDYQGLDDFIKDKWRRVE
jgi:hypothetical protein